MSCHVGIESIVFRALPSRTINRVLWLLKLFKQFLRCFARHLMHCLAVLYEHCEGMCRMGRYVSIKISCNSLYKANTTLLYAAK